MKNVEHAMEEITAGCAMAGLLEMLTRPWTLHVLWLLNVNGPMRFGALRRSAEGISARLLTLRLRTLEQKGFVRRTVKPSIPPEVTYSPTPRLRDMELLMQQLQRLSEKWKREDARAASALLQSGSRPQVAAAAGRPRTAMTAIPKPASSRSAAR